MKFRKRLGFLSATPVTIEGKKLLEVSFIPWQGESLSDATTVCWLDESRPSEGVVAIHTFEPEEKSYGTFSTVVEAMEALKGLFD